MQTVDVTEVGRLMMRKGRENDKGTNILTELKCKDILSGTSLVVQWLGICLPMKGTQVWAVA